jgi:predicted permease
MRLIRHLLAWLRRGRLEHELREELAQHAAWKAEHLEAEGLTPEEARRQAAIALGNPTRVREDTRALWGFPSLDSIVQDVRYGLRQLARAPAFSTVAIASLAIGIGAATAVFSLADAVLLRTMAVKDPSSLFVVKWRSGPVFPFSSLNGVGEQNDTGLASTSFSFAAYDSFRNEASRDLDVVGFAAVDQVNVVIDGRAALGPAHCVSGNYFDGLGVVPQAGRPLGPADDQTAAAPAAVVSDQFWQRRLDGNRSAIGRTILINSVPFTVVGVAPRTFHGTGQIGSEPDIYVPLALKPRVDPNDDPPMDPNFWWVLVLGRLKPGVSAAEARNTLDVLLKRTVTAAKPALAATDLPRIDLLPGGRGQVEMRNEMRDPLQTMAIVTALVLLVACANVAGLLLARGRARMRELSVRVALGAGRGRIVRQLLTEAVMLSVAGTALGLLLARWLSGALAPALTTTAQVPDILAAVDLRVVLFAAATAGASAIGFGLLPAFRATRLNAGATLQEAGRGTVRGSRHRGLSGSLVVAQIALALVLVASAGLLVRTVRNLEHVNLGFNAANLLLFRIDPSLNGYDGARAGEFYARLLDRVRAAPGVTAATMSSHKLISNSSAIGIAARLDEARPAPGTGDLRAFQRTHLSWNLTVDDQFFSTLGIPLLRGRTFTAADAGGRQVAVVNRALARQLFGTDDAIGREFRFGSQKQDHNDGIAIIGIVEDASYTSVRAERPPTMYFYYRQHPEMKNAPTFEVRSDWPPTALAGTMREILHDLDPNLPMYGVTTQTAQIALSLRQERLFAGLAGMLGTIAIVLAAIGLYGLLSYGVAQRTPEIGIRMALGADRGRVLWMVLRESFGLAAIGLAIGVPAALAGTRLLQSMLFGLAARDPETLTAAAAVMLALALVAGLLPARRAARVDPLVALRAE